MNYFKQIWWAKACPLSFYSRIVYSYLIYCKNREMVVSQRQISTALRVNVGNTVSPAIAELLSHGMVEKSRAGISALPFVAEWVFCSPKKQKRANWWQRRNDYYYGVPSVECPLSTIQNAVYWLCRHYSKHYPKMRITYSGMARTLGLDKGQVSRAFQKLQKMGGISKKNVANALFSPMVKLPPENWFAPIKSSKAEKVEVVAKVETNRKYINRVLEELANMRAKSDLLQNIANLSLQLDEAELNPNIMFDAQEFFNNSVKVAKAKYTGEHYGFMLKSVLQGQVNRLQLV